jgi:hypothetical protein
MFVLGDVSINVPPFSLTFSATLAIGQAPVVRIAAAETGIPDAASDGKYYARKDAMWTEFTPGMEDAPADGGTYGRKDGAWAEVAEAGGVQEAPLDNAIYGRANGMWEEITEGIRDAASNGKLYGRKDGAWAEIATGIADAPNDGIPYARKDSAWVKNIGYEPVFGQAVEVKTGAGTAVGADSVIDLGEVAANTNYVVSMLAQSGTTGTSLTDNDIVLALWDGATALHELTERAATVGHASMIADLIFSAVDAGGGNQALSAIPLTAFTQIGFAEASTDIMSATANVPNAPAPVAGMGWKVVPAGTWKLAIVVKAGMDAAITYRVNLAKMPA